MSLRASLAPARAPAANPRPGPRALTDPRGARIVLGAPPRPGAPVAPIAPAADTLFGPRGACLAGRGGPLVVCDTGHHRLLVWRRAPDADGASADCVVGQPHFAGEGRNAKGTIGAATLNVPTGVAVENGVLAVADAWNHRVLLWHGVPGTSNRAADLVLGQADFASGEANRALPAPRADTLNWCYGVAIHGGRLFVADTGNRRVLIWDAIPERNGAPADRVLGQPDFTVRDEAPAGMRWPHAVAVSGDRLLVADAGCSRVMIWNAPPRRNGVPCDLVLGQAGFDGADHNRGNYYPTGATLNMPYGLAAKAGRLLVCDTANSRLLGFDLDHVSMGAAADALAGQEDFDDKGENRWRPAARDSLCWPYGVDLCGDRLVVADSGNNRVLLWDLA
jgi:hypothetical protein